MFTNIKNNIKVLIIDDEVDFTDELYNYLQKSGFTPYSANNAADGYKILNDYEIDLLILDVRLPGVNGLDVLKQVKQIYSKVEVIIISAYGDMDTVIQAVRAGAFDYLRKPLRYIDIQIAIERTQKYLDIQRRLTLIEEKHSLITKDMEITIGRHFIGKSSQILKIFDLAKTASQYPDINVLITGESGTGKENIARIIHYTSDRKDHYFCAVNSSAICESLMESEFFGHKKGAFTGAVADKKGYFEIAHQGTVFLDEIADMPLAMQSKLLRVLEEKIITRVGDTKGIHTNFRIITATNIDLNHMVEEKKFRLDLLHRLNTIHIHIPPLRERTEDIAPLLKVFSDEFSIKLNKPIRSIDDEVFETLSKYDFPGNIRELKNLTERAIILSDSNKLGVKDFPLPSTQPRRDVALHVLEIDKHESMLIRQALSNCNFNQSAAADILGISRDALIRKMKKHHIIISKKTGQ